VRTGAEPEKIGKPAGLAVRRSFFFSGNSKKSEVWVEQLKKQNKKLKLFLSSLYNHFLYKVWIWR
jgi:hypothetical protein